MLWDDVREEFEEVYVKYSKKAAATFIIAIHSTDFGSALGGCRIVDYQSFNHALKDVVGLAKSMSYKAIAAGLPLGGGKSVIIRHDKSVDRRVLFEEFALFVDSLGGKYITAVDAGSTTHDMKVVASLTPFVAGFLGQHDDIRGPAFYTAIGVFAAIKTAVKESLGKESLEGVKVLIQGVGSVGFSLYKMLLSEGADVAVSDVNEKAVKRIMHHFSPEVVAPKDVITWSCDVYAPCAHGNDISDENAASLNAKIVCGSANHVLTEKSVAEKLNRLGVVYCPDYLVNCGGLIYAAGLYEGLMNDDMEAFISEHVGSFLKEVLEVAAKENVAPLQIIDRFVEERLAARRGGRGFDEAAA